MTSHTVKKDRPQTAGDQTNVLITTKLR